MVGFSLGCSCPYYGVGAVAAAVVTTAVVVIAVVIVIAAAGNMHLKAR